MSAYDPQRLAELLELLSDLPDAQRQQRLDALRGEEPALCLELESLLDAHQRAGAFLGHFDAVHAEALLRHDDWLERPRQAGPFHLVREIGRGGLGVVYLGERNDGEFEQRVAVKLIKRGMDSDLIIRRFRAERRILASLDHPSIARLVDGGLLDDGRPWFAMDYIDGLPLTEWCDQHCVGLRHRLKLFEQVCRAVQYAHGCLIVHRDLKPANILVTTDARIRLLDFGIAKLLADDEGESLTMVGQRAMTPEYAAPEQVRGEPVSTATDVHALGVVLYELLTGEQPFLRMAGSEETLAGAICDTDPVAPSAVVVRQDFDSVNTRMNARPTVLCRRLRGDLDTIVLKAMAKDPARRYSSAEELAEDIHRHLVGLPVRARRDSPAYRARRFVLRHRIGVAAMAAVMLALSGGLAAALWQADKARQQADLAAMEALRVERSMAFLTRLFHDGDPRNAARVKTVEELLAVGAERAVHDLGGDELLQSTVLVRLAEVYFYRGELAKAQDLADRAVRLLADRPSGSERQLADAWRIAGSARIKQGQPGEGMPVLELALDAYIELEEAQWVAAVRSEMASAVRQLEGPAAAMVMQREILREVQQRYGPDHIETLKHRHGLAIFAEESGEYALAESEHRRVIEAMERLALQQDPTYAAALLNLASLLDRIGHGDRAGPLFERAIAARIDIYGELAAPVAEARFFYGIFLLGQQRMVEAESNFLALLSVDNLSAAMRAHGHRYLGMALRDQQRHVEAIGEFKNAEDRYLQMDGEVWWVQAYRSAADRGHALVLDGRAPNGVVILREAVAGMEAIRGQSHYELIRPLINLAHAEATSGDLTQAAATAERAVALSTSLLGPDHRFSQSAAVQHERILNKLMGGQ